MSKQDRQGVRSASDLERKYNYERRFSEVMGLYAEVSRNLEEQEAILEAELSLRLGYDDYDQIISMINASADVIKLHSNRLEIESEFFSLSADGKIKAAAGTIGGLTIHENQIASDDGALLFDVGGVVVAQNFSIDKEYVNSITGRTTGDTGLTFDVAEKTYIERTGYLTAEISAVDRQTVIITASVAPTSTIIFDVNVTLSNGTTGSYIVFIAAGRTQTTRTFSSDVSEINYLSQTTFTYYESQADGASGIRCRGVFSPSEDSFYTLGGMDLKWDAIYAASGTIQTSDRNEKTDIAKIADHYGEVFDRLSPVSFKFKKNKSNRTHLGLIAQDVKQILDELGIDSTDFAAYCEWDGGCGLRYEEFVPLIISEIQKLKARVANLEGAT